MGMQPEADIHPKISSPAYLRRYSLCQERKKTYLYH